MLLIYGGFDSLLIALADARMIFHIFLYKHSRVRTNVNTIQWWVDIILIRLSLNCNWSLCEHKHSSWANTYIVVQMLDKNTAPMTNKHSANIMAFAKCIFPPIFWCFQHVFVRLFQFSFRFFCLDFSFFCSHFVGNVLFTGRRQYWIFPWLDT